MSAIIFSLGLLGGDLGDFDLSFFDDFLYLMVLVERVLVAIFVLSELIISEMRPYVDNAESLTMFSPLSLLFLLYALTGVWCEI